MSKTAQAYYHLQKMINIKSILNKMIEKKHRRKRPFFSKQNINKFDIETVYINDKEVSTIGAEIKTTTHIIFLHGGQYVLDAKGIHRSWILRLYQKTKCRITYIDYPLAPEKTYQDTIKMVIDSYQFLVNKYPDDSFILMGDSAGGGLALVIAQYLRDSNHQNRPDKLLLYSPWLNLDMRYDDIIENGTKDMILDAKGLRRSAKEYAANSPLSHKYLSPVNNSCKDLGEIVVYYGENEMFAPDIMLFEKQCREENLPSVFYSYQGMQHVFHLFLFLPESKDVMKKTISMV